MTANETETTRRASDLILLAFESRASDIHLQPTEGALEVRLRIDGVLQRQPDVPAEEGVALVQRLKTMSALNTDVTDCPQDGRIFLDVKEKRLDLRVSTLPTVHGER
ncbi:MAG: Flp pilus assembly complex ATPase component TadA, partial [Victivallales bacterium]|nr:Flp pilus assembly complex ATPase component TadA [Victivallales bacterium]